MGISEIVSAQKAYFARGVTKDVSFRIRALAKLRQEILRRQADIFAALKQDLGKQASEAYMSEVGLTLSEMRYTIKNLRRWAQDKSVKSPLINFPSKSFIQHEPYGVALVMSPWNYPFMLSLTPVAGALAAGNCVVLKPSAYSPATSSIVREILEACFKPEYVAVVEGGRAENQALLEQRFDYIFFTGSVEVGKLVMEKAARNLTPVSLELGGKSPCIVDNTADISTAARRIVFGKFLNAGQTCIAPDYLLVHRDVKVPLMRAMRKEIANFFGEYPLLNPALPKIINKKHYDRLMGLLEGEKVYCGGIGNGEDRIAPTLLDEVSSDRPVMQEEIFGPVLPVITFDLLSEAINFVTAREKPLALYVFTTSKTSERRVLSECSFGGGCVNDTIMHFTAHHLPFGGVGHSGMGQYHGKSSFDTFTHKKGILKKGNWLDIPIRYHPYSKLKDKFTHFFLR